MTTSQNDVIISCHASSRTSDVDVATILAADRDLRSASLSTLEL